MIICKNFHKFFFTRFRIHSNKNVENARVPNSYDKIMDAQEL